MDELIVRVARAVASLPRLRIVSALAAVKEKAPSALADELGMAPNVMSAHLRILESAGLLQRRRSGRWSYCLAKSPYGDQTLSGGVAVWLRSVLRSPGRVLEHPTVRELWDVRRGEGDAVDLGDFVAELVFEAATAFTNVRRLQILRRLTEEGQAGAAALTEELHMSEQAVGRHMAKLVRRGYVVAGRDGRMLVHRLADRPKSPIHRELARIVVSTWEGQ